MIINQRLLTNIRKSRLKRYYFFGGHNLNVQVEAILAKQDSNATTQKAIFITSKVEERTATTANKKVIESIFTTKTEAATTTTTVNPFNTIMIDKGQTKTKGFTVEFNKR